MPADSATPTRRGRNAVSNGTRTFDGIDNRDPSVRRFRDVQAALAADIGGEGLTEAQLQLCRTAAGLVLLRERLDVGVVKNEPVRASDYATVANSLRHVLATIGLGRTPREVDASYAQRLAREVEEDEALASLRAADDAACEPEAETVAEKAG
jgi:hypothetical protein